MEANFLFRFAQSRLDRRSIVRLDLAARQRHFPGMDPQTLGAPDHDKVETTGASSSDKADQHRGIAQWFSGCRQTGCHPSLAGIAQGTGGRKRPHSAGSGDDFGRSHFLRDHARLPTSRACLDFACLMG